MSRESDRKRRILLFQTEVPGCISDAADKLRREGCFPNAEILLVCSEVDRERFEATGKFQSIHTYSKAGALRKAHKLKQAIKHFDPDVSSAVFSGRPIFRKPKLAFLLLSSSDRYVFDARMEGYWLRFGSFRRLLLQDQKAMAKYAGELDQLEDSLRTLLIETEASEAVEKAIEIISKPEVVPNARISLFCSLERTREFETNRALYEIRSYSKESILRDLRIIWSLFRSRPDVVAAIFSGRRIFLKQKILFWLIPARARLVINENNDCAYVSRWNALNLLRVQSPESPVDMVAGRRVANQIVKGILFLPRFAYLLIWITLMKLLRAYRLEQAAKYTSPRPGE